jgi:hypothetical protein
MGEDCRSNCLQLALLARLTSLTQIDGADLAQLLRANGETRREDDSYCNCL